jgi:hypothetical protein
MQLQPFTNPDAPGKARESEVKVNQPRAIWRNRDFWLALLLVAIGLLIILPRFQPAPHVHGDGLGYFSYLPALFAGRPFDLYEFAAPKQHVRWRHYRATGRTVNQWCIGPAVAWLPWYAAGRLLYPQFPLTDDRMWIACGVGTIVITLSGIVLLFLALRALVPWWAALAAAAAGLLCTPVLAYSTAVPFFSHHLTFALVGVLLWLVLTRDLRSAAWAPWAVAGLACGLLTATRLPRAFFAILPFAMIWPHKPQLRQVTAFGAAFLLMFAPQMLFWKMTFGQWLVIPQTAIRPNFLRAPAVWQVLWSPLHGLFFWHPLLLVGIIGLGFALWQPALRRLAALALILFAIETLMNAMPFDWWASWAFGARRFCDIVPLLSVGLAFLLMRLPILLVAVLAAGWWNLAMLWAWMRPAPEPSGFVLHPEQPLTLPVARAILAHLLHPFSAVSSAGVAQLRQHIVWLAVILAVSVSSLVVAVVLRQVRGRSARGGIS